MRVNVFAARCITNLHVGNGDVNYNIIDQEVERDPVNSVPIINSSGVKGAIKEFFESKWGKNDNRVSAVFGDENAQGSYKFLQADLLFRPLRVSDNSKRSYILATTEEIINDFRKKVTGLSGVNEAAFEQGFASSNKEKVHVEGENDSKTVKSNEEKWKAVTEKDFIIVDNLNLYDLPVIARNVLDDNGISKNLWYEEFVPHESVFGFIILTPDEMDKEFKDLLLSNPVQFGGNASVGYGLMEFKEVVL